MKINRNKFITMLDFLANILTLMFKTGIILGAKNVQLFTFYNFYNYIDVPKG